MTTTSASPADQALTPPAAPGRPLAEGDPPWRVLGAPPADGVVCFAGVDWWYHNRGHSECQIMRRLASRATVLWINSIGMRLPTREKTELTGRRYIRKARSMLKGLRRDESGMWVYTPLFLPRYDERAVAINGALLRAQAAALQRLLGIRRPSAWLTIPTAIAAVEKGRWQTVVFNRSDDFSRFPEADGAFIRGLERRCLARAEHTLYVNRELFDRERGEAHDARWLGHGVDFSHFAAAYPPTPGSCPDILRDLPRPLVGFYGALDNYTVDLDLMIKVARSLKQGTMVVIGPQAMDIGRLVAEPNVRWFPPIPYADVPKHAAQFDVALMPWLDNEWIRGCNPIKLKEYLAIGFPIVSIRFGELQRYENVVHAASGHEEFIAAVHRALSERDPSMIERRRATVLGDSWDALSEKVGDLLNVPARRRAG